jgi:hypothetical protein
MLAALPAALNFGAIMPHGTHSGKARGRCARMAFFR